MHWDSLEMHVVSDGLGAVEPGGPFGLVPRKLWQSVVPVDADGRVPMALNCLLLRSHGKTILVDTGLGTNLSERDVQRWSLRRPEGSLLDALARLGVSPADVDVVLNTHLHWDHCGGNTTLDSGRLRATFPRAEYWVQYVEWAQAIRPDERTQATYRLDGYVPLMPAGQMRLLHGDTPVTPQVRCVVTPGHTRAHQCVMLESGGNVGLVLGDMATYAVHFERLAWVTAFDVEPLENIRSKRRWQRWALEHDAWLFFEHDTQMPVGKAVADGKRLSVKSVSLS